MIRMPTKELITMIIALAAAMQMISNPCIGPSPWGAYLKYAIKKIMQIRMMVIVNESRNCKEYSNGNLLAMRVFLANI